MASASLRLLFAGSAAPFRTTVGGIEYAVRPVFTYDLSGVVVSKHDADTWWDWIHKAWRDELNVTDLCVIWGANARGARYGELEYWSGQFECNVRTGSTEVWGTFDMAALSNNHLLTDDPAIARALKSARVGDQVRFRGYLAEYSHDHGFHFFRGTSTRRTDTGNGACETVYVTEVWMLREGNRGWRRALWLAIALLVASLAASIALPYRARN